MKTLSGLWYESSSKRFFKRIKYDPADLFDGPVLVRMREFVDFGAVRNVLSIGCGNGRFELPLLQRFPITVDFIEPSPFMFEQLSKNLSASRDREKREFFSMVCLKSSLSKSNTISSLAFILFTSWRMP
jgi:SAM-dependent methyltransferase